MNMIRKVIWIVTVCLLQFFLAGMSWALITATPTHEWTATFDGSKSMSDRATATAVDSDGNVYVTGYSDNTRFHTLKYDRDGNELWAVSHSGSGSIYQARAMAVDNAGNVYVTGTVRNFNYDNVTIKYNSAGVEQWVSSYDGGGNDDVAAIGLYVDSGDGNTYVYITGKDNFDNSSSAMTDYVTVKYAATDGSEQWAVRYDGPEGSEDIATAMTVDSSGNVYVTGNSRGTTTTGQDIATIKYNKEGVEQWATRHAGPGSNKDIAYATGIDSTGNVYVTGRTGNDAITVKYSPAGIVEWEQINTGALYGRSLAVDSAANVIITGSGITIKYNTAGVQQWAISDADAGSTSDVAVDENGNIFVLGYLNLSGELNDYDFATVMYNGAGVQQWVQNFASSGNGWDIPYAMTVYTDTISQTSRVIVTGEGGTYGSSDFITAMYDISGSEAWVQRFDGTGSSDADATDIDVDSAGNVYVTGTTYTGSVTDSGYEDQDYVVTKYSSDGTELWASQSEDSSVRDEAAGVVVDADGNVYITATTETSSADDIVTVKYNSAGEVLGQVTFDGGSWDTAMDIGLFVDPDDGQTFIYVLAQSANNNLDQNYTLIKYDADLVEHWVRSYTYTIGSAYPAAMAIDSSGNAYLTGQSETVAGFMAYATVKFDKNGEEIWDMGYDLDGQGDEAEAIAVDNAGNVYVTGTARYSAGASTTDCITIKYDIDGNEQWVARYDGNGESDSCKDIAVDAQGNVYVAGEGGTGVQYDRDYITIKYDATGVEQWVNRWDGGSNYADNITAIAVDNMGLVYITGQSKTDASYHSDYVTIAYDTDGNELWLQRYNNGNTGAYSIHDNRPVAMVVKDDGNVYVTGESTGIDTGRDFGTIKYSQEILNTDDDLPVITEVSPADQATGIAITSLVTATFSEPMDQLNIEDPATFTLQETVSGTPVNGTVQYDDVSMIARFTPGTDLAYNTQFTATISTAATDVSGNALAEDRVWQFTTLPQPDTTAPMVTGNTPSETTGVAVSPLITVSFDEPVAANTITTSTFTLVNTSTGSAVTGTVSYDTGTHIARFDPASPLAYSTNYTAMISTAVTDLAGNPLAENYSWSFTTGSEPDTTSPEVLPESLSPATGSADVAVYLETVSAEFSESMDETTINGSSFTLFNDTTGSPVSDGVVTYNAGRVTLTLGSNLDYDSSYTVTIMASVADISGNTLATNYSWSFSTEGEPPVQEETPPQVISVTPTGIYVPASVGAVTVSFSEPVQGIDINSFTVSASGNAIQGTVQYDSAAMTAWLRPSADLAYNTTYTVTIASAQVRDMADNYLPQDYSWSFTTDSDPALVGCEPEIGAEADCENFDHFSYGTGVEVNTYGSSITGYVTESGARQSVSYGVSLSQDSAPPSTSFESEAEARVDSTQFSLHARSRRMELSQEFAGAWSMGATKIDVAGAPPGTLIPMSIVTSGSYTGNGGSLMLQIRDFDSYTMLGSAAAYGSIGDIRVDFLYPAIPNNGIYVWFVAGVHSSLSSGETDYTATLQVNPPPGVTISLASGQVFTGTADTDGDGVSDDEEGVNFLNNASVASPAAATGTGNITVSVSDEGVTLSQVQVFEADDPNINQTGKPTDQQFLDGLVSFRINGLAPGATATVTLTFPTAFPQGASYYKINDNGFFEFLDADINGNTVTLTITDGATGDNDGQANGVIVDPGGVAVPADSSTNTGTIFGNNDDDGFFGIGAFNPLLLLAMLIPGVLCRATRRHRYT